MLRPRRARVSRQILVLSAEAVIKKLFIGMPEAQPILGLAGDRRYGRRYEILASFPRYS